ncbi:MAG: hypothetical protein WAV05_18440 [Anaerolineales bacterium]
MTNNSRPRWFFYPAWVALSGISIPIAAVIVWALISLAVKVIGGTIQVGGQTHFTEDYLTGYIGLLFFGLTSGYLQYLLLRRHLPRMGWWIAATTSGLLLGAIGERLLLPTMYSTLDSMWLGILGTVVIFGPMGLVQWLVLRRRVSHAIWWIPASILGWYVVAWGLYSLSVIPGIGIWLVPGIATSIVLWLVLDQLPRLSNR